MPLSSVELPLLLEMQKKKTKWNPQYQPASSRHVCMEKQNWNLSRETAIWLAQRSHALLTTRGRGRGGRCCGQQRRSQVFPGQAHVYTHTHTHILRVWSGAFSPDCSNMEWIGKNVQDWGSFEKALTPRVKRGCQAIFVSAIGSALSRGRVEFERSCSRPRAQS